MRKSAFLWVLFPALALLLPEEGFAQIQARFSYDAKLNCTNPPTRDYTVHFDGTGSLSTDRSASLDLQSDVTGRENYNVKLGEPASAVRDGTASLRVMSRKSLRAVREYPNNLAIIEIRVSGSSCGIKIEHRLKPGKKQYTFTTPMGLAYCDRPRTVNASCTAN
jgi:hypothetical protein